MKIDEAIKQLKIIKFNYENLKSYRDNKALLKAEAIETVLKDRERIQKDFTEVDHECLRLEKVDIEKDLIIDKQNKIIDLMAEMINNHDIDEDICMQMGKYKQCEKYSAAENCKSCIKQYFEKEVEKSDGLLQK